MGWYFSGEESEEKSKVLTPKLNSELEAILQADNGLKALVDSIASEKEFLEYLQDSSLRKLIKSRLKDDSKVQEWAKSALTVVTFVTHWRDDLPVLEILCDLTGAKGVKVEGCRKQL